MLGKVCVTLNGSSESAYSMIRHASLLVKKTKSSRFVSLFLSGGRTQCSGGGREGREGGREGEREGGREGRRAGREGKEGGQGGRARREGGQGGRAGREKGGRERRREGGSPNDSMHASHLRLPWQDVDRFR